MNVEQLATEYINELRALDDEGPTRGLCFERIVVTAKSSKLMADVVREMYALAAAGKDWELSRAEVSMLVYAPLQNRALIPLVKDHVRAILRRQGASGLLTGWQYVENLASDRFEPSRESQCFPGQHDKVKYDRSLSGATV